MLALMPVALVALTGAASNPTVTFHGYIDDYTVVPGAPPRRQWTWSSQARGARGSRIPDPTVGAHAWLNVQSRAAWLQPLLQRRGTGETSGHFLRIL
jgi:hypothetical protein